jgi:hypothetical protein
MAPMTAMPLVRPNVRVTESRPEAMPSISVVSVSR